MATLFALSTKWKNYDVFARQKLETFQSSRPAVLELASRYKALISELSSSKPADPKAEEVIFSEMMEICLWGNATDLSLLTNLSYEDIQKLQGSAARKAAEKNILVNDLPRVFADLKKIQKERPNDERRIDIVLDNAGFELFVDLILAGYLIKAGLATNIILHPKSIPWFVSDVLPSDFTALLNALADPQGFYTGATVEGQKAGATGENAKSLSDIEVAELKFLFEDWSTLHSEGQLVIRPNSFWTQAGSYWRLPYEAPKLYEDLRESDLVIFKGDLNSRKLAGDVMWPTTTSYTEALGPLAKQGSGINVLGLRTCKADTVVGLPEGKDEELKATEGGGGESGARKWAWSGKWAVVNYSPARPPVSFAKTDLGYPIFSAEFDPYNRGYLTVGGGGGENKAGIANKIVHTQNLASLTPVAELDLSREEDSVSSLASLTTKEGLIAFTGIGSSTADKKKGINEHFRSFSIAYPERVKDAEKQKQGVIAPLSKTCLFRPANAADKQTYQALVKLSPVTDRSTPTRRIGAIATGLAPTGEIVLFEATSATPDNKSVCARITLEKGLEPHDLDIAVRAESKFAVAYCTDNGAYLYSLAYDFSKRKATPDDEPTTLYKIQNSTTGKGIAPPPRLRWLTPNHLLLLVNNNPGVELLILHVGKPGQPGRVVARKTLSSSIKSAVSLAVCSLDADPASNERQAASSSKPSP
ncbi:hypothetical protein FH972_023568 [Carpinus fangiana]|uniref:Damage-control phosphatase ARMT1-like metal-binding domain-containing protein n=1 Tax=Carpinus fangiana TaxID=176857 RepID=A0A5N6KVY0_9ROSI|nr:hypothetical protein FH972_023568 [Carpinus fangiana]